MVFGRVCFEGFFGFDHMQLIESLRIMESYLTLAFEKFKYLVINELSKSFSTNLNDTPNPFCATFGQAA